MKIYRILPEQQAIALAAQASTFSWQEGQARTKELTGTVKRNEEITKHVSLAGLGQRIAKHPEILLDHLVYQIFPPKYSRYREGSRYHLHTDAPWMGKVRTDLSCTLFLSSPSEYDGGELVISGTAIKPQAGEAVVYECGLPHEVKEVTRGERICAVTWLQSRVRCPSQRQVVVDLRKLVGDLEDDQELFVQGSRIHSALLRMWSET